MHHSNLLNLLLVSLITQAISQKYTDCNKDTFYSFVTLSDRSQLQSLLESKHRHVLPYTSSSANDVWDALIDIDGITQSNERYISLIYTQTIVPAFEYGTSTTWNREHLWPRSYGVEESGPDNTDLHHIYPADANVNSARGNKYFADCGVVEQESACRTPGHTEAPDTKTDMTVFVPPENVRGDIARALFYMDVRYNGKQSNTNDLRLVDCPTGESQMAYLSQLLQWHTTDPVDDKELQRNNDICSNWQGNRNPFVDFPNLATDYFTSQSFIPGVGYDCSHDANEGSSSNQGTNSGTSGSQNTNSYEACQQLTQGDIIISAFQADDPDQVILAALTDIPAGVEIYMTDNAWTGTNFKTNEGVLKLVPNQTINRNALFEYNATSITPWEKVSGSFSLATSNGDNIILYCLTTDSINFLTAVIYSNQGWLPANQEDYSTASSSLPPGISNAHVELMHEDNYYYSGIKSGDKSDILESYNRNNNWVGSSENSFDIMKEEFNVIASSSNVDQSNSAICHFASRNYFHVTLFSVMFLITLIL